MNPLKLLVKRILIIVVAVISVAAVCLAVDWATANIENARLQAVGNQQTEVSHALCEANLGNVAYKEAAAKIMQQTHERNGFRPESNPYPGSYPTTRPGDENNIVQVKP